MAKRVAKLAAQVVASTPYVEQLQKRAGAGGLLLVEHLNMNVVDNKIADPFYKALGCSRNEQFPPTMMHANVGLLCQFHMPDPNMEKRILDEGSQIWRGKIEILYNDEAELAAAAKRVEGLVGKPEYQKVTIAGSGDGTVVTGPWGNRFSLRVATSDQKVAYGESYGVLPNMRPPPPPKEGKKPKVASPRPTCLGLGDIYIEVPTGAAAKIARFYSEIFHFETQENGPGNWSVVGGPNGNCQALRFQDVTDAKPWGGEHLAMYIGDYESTFQRVDSKGLVWQNPRFIKIDNVRTLEEARKSQQFRMKDIIDLDNGEVIFTLEHEVRGYESKLSPLWKE